MLNEEQKKAKKVWDKMEVYRQKMLALRETQKGTNLYTEYTEKAITVAEMQSYLCTEYGMPYSFPKD